MKFLLDQTEETILRMKKFTFKSLRKTENDLQLTTWWTDARLQNIYFLIIPREKELFLTDQGHTFNLIKEEKSPLINKRKKVFLKSLLLSLEAFQEGENLVAYSSLHNLENILFSYTQALITLNGLAMIEKW